MTPGLKIELLPELRAAVGLSLRRARARLVLPDGSSAVALGAGIAASPALALAKAISEAAERLTTLPRVFSEVVARRIDLTGNLAQPTAAPHVAEPIRRRPRGRSAAACHVGLDEAIRAAFTEAVERRHLWAWSQACSRPKGVLAFDLDLRPSSPVGPVWTLLAQHELRLVVSWHKAGMSLPSAVCFAINEGGGYFYAGSAAALSRRLALEAALLDVAKVLLVEEAFEGSRDALGFRRDLQALPPWLWRDRSPVDFPWTAAAMTVEVVKVRLSRSALQYEAPWLTGLGRYLVSLPVKTSGPYPAALEWFK